MRDSIICVHVHRLPVLHSKNEPRKRHSTDVSFLVCHESAHAIHPSFGCFLRRYTGGGIPNLYRVWKAEGWPEPVFTESRNPDRVPLTLSMTSHSSGETATGGKQVPLGALSQRQLLIDHLTDHPTSDLFALSKALGVSLSRTESLLQRLADEGIVTAETNQGNHLYKLKA